jgi:hypothetical protein
MLKLKMGGNVVELVSTLVICPKAQRFKTLTNFFEQIEAD